MYGRFIPGTREVKQGFRPAAVPGAKLGARQGEGTAPHHLALQRLAELAPELPGSGDGKGVLQSLRERRVRLRANADRTTAEETYVAAREFLLAPDRWTYGNMLAYQRKVLELMGATGWRRRLMQDEKSVVDLEKELTVLEAMTPAELASNHKSVFNSESVKLIAEKSKQTERFVKQVILSHDMLRADRRWYKILEQFGKPLPKSFEDRNDWAEYDRPFSETENEMREDMMEASQRSRPPNQKPPRIRWIWYRHPSCGGSRWSSRPPKWYPVNWKMRPERKLRMAGVGVPGGGGDRGTPRGGLQRFWKQGGWQPSAR